MEGQNTSSKKRKLTPRKLTIEQIERQSFALNEINVTFEFDSNKPNPESPGNTNQSPKYNKRRRIGSSNKSDSAAKFAVIPMPQEYIVIGTILSFDANGFPFDSIAFVIPHNEPQNFPCIELLANENEKTVVSLQDQNIVSHIESLEFLIRKKFVSIC